MVEHQVGFRLCGSNSHTSDFMSHPIPHKSDSSERLGNSDSLLISRVEPIFVRPLVLAHGLFAFLISFDMLFQSGQNFSAQRAVVPFCNLFHLLQYVSRETDGERFDVFFFVTHASIVQQKWMHIKWLQYPVPQPQTRNGTLIPRFKDGGFPVLGSISNQ